MLDEAPGLRFVLAALRVLVGACVAILAVGLLIDVRIEEVDVSCGFAPAAAIAHDEVTTLVWDEEPGVQVRVAGYYDLTTILRIAESVEPA